MLVGHFGLDSTVDQRCHFLDKSARNEVESSTKRAGIHFRRQLVRVEVKGRRRSDTGSAYRRPRHSLASCSNRSQEILAACHHLAAFGDSVAFRAPVQREISAAQTSLQSVRFQETSSATGSHLEYTAVDNLLHRLRKKRPAGAASSPHPPVPHHPVNTAHGIRAVKHTAGVQ